MSDGLAVRSSLFLLPLEIVDPSLHGQCSWFLSSCWLLVYNNYNTNAGCFWLITRLGRYFFFGFDICVHAMQNTTLRPVTCRSQVGLKTSSSDLWPGLPSCYFCWQLDHDYIAMGHGCFLSKISRVLTLQHPTTMYIDSSWFLVVDWMPLGNCSDFDALWISLLYFDQVLTPDVPEDNGFQGGVLSSSEGSDTTAVDFNQYGPEQLGLLPLFLVLELGLCMNKLMSKIF